MQSLIKLIAVSSFLIICCTPSLSQIRLEYSSSEENENVLQHQQTNNIEIFASKKSKTLIKKIILTNGFLLIEELIQHWTGTVWVNDRKYTNVYDENENIIEKFFRGWGGQNWGDIYSWSYAYDGNNNLLEEVKKVWLDTNWVNSERWIYNYDSNNNLIEEIVQSWYDNSWRNGGRSEYV